MVYCPQHRQSSIQVLTRPGIRQQCWLTQCVNQYTTIPPLCTSCHKTNWVQFGKLSPSNQQIKKIIQTPTSLPKNLLHATQIDKTCTDCGCKNDKIFFLCPLHLLTTRAKISPKCRPTHKRFTHRQLCLLNGS